MQGWDSMIYLFFIFNCFLSGSVQYRSWYGRPLRSHMLNFYSWLSTLILRKQQKVNNNKDETWTYLTIHCKLPGNALNLIPANFSWKPFDLGGKVGIGYKRKLKQIFIKIYVHTKHSHPQPSHSFRRGNWRKFSFLTFKWIMFSHVRTEWRDRICWWERGSRTWQGWLEFTTPTLSNISS